MVDLNQPPDVEDSMTKLTAEQAAEAIKQDVNGTLDIQISNLTNSDMGIDSEEEEKDETGMSDDDEPAMVGINIEGSAKLFSITDGDKLVQQEKEVAFIAANANELTTQMGDATIAILKLLNYYDVVKRPYTTELLERIIPQLTGVGISRDTIADLMFMLNVRDFITPEPRFSEVPWTITARGRAFLILDYNLSNISNL